MARCKTWIMDLDGQLNEALKQAFSPQPGGRGGVIAAEVLEVNGAFVDVKTVEGIVLYRVKLGAGGTPENLETPVKGSWVLITPLQQKDSYAVLRVDKPELLRLFAASQIQILTQGDSLRGIFADLISALEQLNVSTPSGPSSTPNNIQAFSAIKKRVNDFFKE